MPMYEFKCRKCGKITTELTSQQLKPVTRCKHCNEPADRIMATSNSICHFEELIKKK
jgi:putative FmdB family regulatory protein